MDYCLNVLRHLKRLEDSVHKIDSAPKVPYHGDAHVVEDSFIESLMLLDHGLKVERDWDSEFGADLVAAPLALKLQCIARDVVMRSSHPQDTWSVTTFSHSPSVPPRKELSPFFVRTRKIVKDLKRVLIRANIAKLDAEANLMRLWVDRASAGASVGNRVSIPTKDVLQESSATARATQPTGVVDASATVGAIQAARQPKRQQVTIEFTGERTGPKANRRVIVFNRKRFDVSAAHFEVFRWCAFAHDQGLDSATELVGNQSARNKFVTRLSDLRSKKGKVTAELRSFLDSLQVPLFDKAKARFNPMLALVIDGLSTSPL